MSWGGFKRSVLEEARKLFFEIRLWDADDLIVALSECYGQLPRICRPSCLSSGVDVGPGRVELGAGGWFVGLGGG